MRQASDIRILLVNDWPVIRLGRVLYECRHSGELGSYSELKSGAAVTDEELDRLSDELDQAAADASAGTLTEVEPGHYVLEEFSEHASEKTSAAVPGERPDTTTERLAADVDGQPTTVASSLANPA